MATLGQLRQTLSVVVNVSRKPMKMGKIREILWDCILDAILNNSSDVTGTLTFGRTSEQYLKVVPLLILSLLTFAAVSFSDLLCQTFPSKICIVHIIHNLKTMIR